MRVSNEIRLLTLVSREIASGSRCEEIAGLLPQCRDPGDFAALCISQRTAALAESTLRRFPDNRFACESRRLLRTFLVTQWLPLHARLRDTLEIAGTCLKKAEIRFLVLKGLSLAEQYYLEPQKRISCDIDLLVPERLRKDATRALLESGFEFVRPQVFIEAQDAYVGQVELRHAETRVLLDLNWRLTENASIGPVSPDMDLLWERAELNRGGWNVPSAEDTLFHVVRHAVHGHDLRSGVLVACADVAALLRAVPKLDENYLAHQLRFAESCRAYIVFAHYYARRYQSEAEPPIPVPGSILGACGLRRNPIVSVRMPEAQFKLAPRDRVFAQWLSINLGMCCKFWSTDSVARTWRLWKVVVWPNRSELVLLGDAGVRFGPAMARLRLYLSLALLLPGVLLGTFLRAADSVLRPFLGLRGSANPAQQCLCPNPANAEGDEEYSPSFSGRKES